MNSVAPVWDGNETWLVLGGGGLMAAFPLAYAVVMPALYAPIIAMLLALIFRGVAFEFRWRARAPSRCWDWAFAGGSMLAAFAQGIALGALVQGIPVSDRAYAGGWWDWLTPFSLLTGVALRRRLCAARRHLAHHEDHRRAAGARAPLRLDHRPRHAGADRHRQPVDAADERPVHGALVRLARHPLRGAGAAASWRLAALVLFRGLAGRRDVCAVPRGASRCSCCPTSASASASIPTSCRPRSPSGRPRRPTPASSSCWSARVVLVPADPRLHRLVLLGVPRQGRPRRRAITDGRRDAPQQPRLAGQPPRCGSPPSGSPASPPSRLLGPPDPLRLLL